MDIEQLRYFLIVCECKQMTLAADRLFISQSSLSKHIARLEKEVGVPLFDRAGRNLQITSAGMEFAQYAREAVARQEAVLSRLRNRQPEKASLTLGAIPVLTQYALHKKLLQFQEANPQIDLNVIEEKSDNILKLLDDELVELAIVRTSSLVGDGYKVLPLLSDELVLLCGKRHPLADAEAVRLAELAGEQFLWLDTGPASHDLARQACQKTGFAPRIMQSFTRIETILGYVAEHAGVALLMQKSLAAFDCHAVCQKKITPAIPSTVALVFPHGRKLTAAARSLRDFFRMAG